MKFYRVRFITRYEGHEDHLWPYLEEAETQFNGLIESKSEDQMVVLEEITLVGDNRFFSRETKRTLGFHMAAEEV